MGFREELDYMINKYDTRNMRAMEQLNLVRSKLRYYKAKCNKLESENQKLNLKLHKEKTNVSQSTTSFGQ